MRARHLVDRPEDEPLAEPLEDDPLACEVQRPTDTAFEAGVGT